ncbi:hypothetical protein F4780DRAFT_779094 [Xylariomycetidae sp. FL0641]|nr:hypothetical protein F4780DRAFT_779094 [Xylariomycetidae sp. FL0641]
MQFYIALAFLSNQLVGATTFNSSTTTTTTSNSTAEPFFYEKTTCSFYGWIEGSYTTCNRYYVQLAGWGNDGSAGACGRGLLAALQRACGTPDVHDWDCAQIHAHLHDTQVGFSLGRDAKVQPQCVSDAIRLASQGERHNDNVLCHCLAECMPSETRRGVRARTSLRRKERRWAEEEGPTG